MHSLVIGFVVLILDIISKYLTQAHLPHYSLSPFYPYGGIGIFQNFFGLQFSLNYAENQGAAWGMFAEYSQWLLLIRLGLIGSLGIYFYKLPRTSTYLLPLALIIAGAIGNVLDIFIYGHVIDMFHWILWGYDYPIFNIADSAICVGVCLYLLRSFLASHASTQSS